MKRGFLGWFLLTLAIGIVCIFFYSRHVGAPELANDSYQYLDAASHLAAGGCLCTDFAHFDEQVKWGHMPIPFMHFGPGYPVVIGALRTLGVPVETAGYLLSASAYLAVSCLIWLAGYYLAIQPWAIALVCVVWSLNASALDFGVSVATDCLFTALLAGLCTLLAYDIRNLNCSAPFVLLGMGAVVGASYWLRQPGLFLLFPLFLYLVWRSIVAPRSRLYGFATLLVAGLLAAPVMLRNILLTHSWNSGFANGRHTPWKLVLSDTLKAPYHILFGDNAVARVDIWTGLFLLSGAIILWRALVNYRAHAVPHISTTTRTILLWLLVFGASFTACILVAELRTYAASEVRYNFPVFPLVLLGGAVLFQCAGDRIGRIAIFICVFSIVTVNARSLLAPRTSDQSSLPIDLLQQQVQPGLSIQAFIGRTVPRDSVLFATEGQAVYYLLHRPIVSIIEPQYSQHTWDDSDIKAAMQSFGAQYFLLFPGAGKVHAPEQESSPFLRSLTAGHPPAWMTIAARTPGVILYRRIAP